MREEGVRVGIVGVGGIAASKHLPALSRLPNVELTAFCDIVEARARKGAAEFGDPGASVCTDYRRLVELPDLDVVHVLTPNCHHAAISAAALDAGKHVLCEKPMAVSAEEGRAMIAAARRSGKKLTIGYQNRFRPDVQYLKQFCADGHMGEIYLAHALALRRRGLPAWGVYTDRQQQGGGALIDAGTHAVDLVLWLMDNYAWDSVMAVTSDRLGRRAGLVNPSGRWDHEHFEVEDTAAAMIRFQNGAAVLVETSWLLNTLQGCRPSYILYGTKAGADYLDGLRINGESYGRLYETYPDLHSGIRYAEGRLHDDFLEAEHWIDAIVNDTQPLVRAEEAFAVTEIIDGIYESAQTGRAVYANDGNS